MMHKKLDHVKWTAGARVTLEKMYRVPQGSGGYQTLAFFCGLTHMGACECGWVCVRGLQKPVGRSAHGYGCSVSHTWRAKLWSRGFSGKQLSVKHHRRDEQERIPTFCKIYWVLIARVLANSKGFSIVDGTKDSQESRWM